MAGEAEKYAMQNSFIPATDEELDRWLRLGLAGGLADVAAYELAHGAVPRLVQEVVLGRSMLRMKQRDLEEAQRRERANAVLVQRAEQALAEAEKACAELRRRLV